jgi:putative transcriptional regulator
VADLVNDTPPPGLARVPVFLGGPVGKNQLMFAAFEWQTTNGLKLNHNIALDEAKERVAAEPGSIRAFVGYAGWSAGQLEAEMKQNAWIVQRPTRGALKPERLPRLWFEIMKGLGPWYKMLAAAPDDPSLN